MIQYYIEKLLLNIALFFLRITYLGNVAKDNVTTYEYYSEWVTEYLKNFKTLIKRR